MTKRLLGVSVTLAIWLGWVSVSQAALHVAPDPVDFGDIHVGNNSSLAPSITADGPGSESYDSVTLTPIAPTTLSDCSQFVVSPTAKSVNSAMGSNITVT